MEGSSISGSGSWLSLHGQRQYTAVVQWLGQTMRDSGCILAQVVGFMAAFLLVEKEGHSL